MIQVAIIGAGGLSGLELITWLHRHPQANIKVITSGKYAGQALSARFPQFAGTPYTFQNHDADLSGCDMAFLAIPNKASLDIVPELLNQRIRVIDLSGVYRLKDPDVFEKYYKLKHDSKVLLNEAVFGLPEYYKTSIANARLIANPGCYPTGSLLGILPFGELLSDLAIPPIIDAKSGVSGAGGRVEDDTTNYVSVNENFKAYKLFGHQHTPEIQQYLNELSGYQADQHGNVIFTPHLLPLTRGILSTIYLSFQKSQEKDQVMSQFEEAARAQPFLELLPYGTTPELKMVQHTNRCYVGLTHDDTGKNWIVVTAIDNLLKGASGQAIQNMNLMFGLDETTGLL